MNPTISRLFQFSTKVLRFVLYGVPAFLIAIPLNWVLVKLVGLPEPLAYALVLLVQVILNFFVCVLFVFKRDESKSIWSQFLAFLSGILVARLLDLALYSIMVIYTPIHFIALQALNVIIFSAMKFVFAQRALEGKSLKADSPKL